MKKSFEENIEDLEKIVSQLENNTLVRLNSGRTFVDWIDTDALQKYNIVVSNVSGVVIVDIVENHPLHLSNIIEGDVITKINDVVIEDIFDLQREIYSYQIGDTITLGDYRGMIYSEANVVLNK